MYSKCVIIIIISLFLLELCQLFSMNQGTYVKFFSFVRGQENWIKSEIEFLNSSSRGICQKVVWSVRQIVRDVSFHLHRCYGFRGLIKDKARLIHRRMFPYLIRKPMSTCDVMRPNNFSPLSIIEGSRETEDRIFKAKQVRPGLSSEHTSRRRSIVVPAVDCIDLERFVFVLFQTATLLNECIINPK